MRNYKRYFLTLILLFAVTAVYSQDSLEINLALNILNKTRKDAGLDTVTISDAISKGCYNHAKYLVLNKNSSLVQGMSGHKEYPQLKGYSKSGESAAKNSVIHYVKPSEAIIGWIQTFYHRVPLLQPNLKKIGIGFYTKDGYTACLIECSTGKEGECLKEVVYYPNEKQSNVPLMMGPEIPNPMGVDGQYGFPITIYFTKWQKVKNASFKLTTSTGKVVECSVSTPEKPATYFAQWNTICAIPKRPLLPETSYLVAVSCLVDGASFKKTFEFKTAKE